MGREEAKEQAILKHDTVKNGGDSVIHEQERLPVELGGWCLLMKTN